MKKITALAIITSMLILSACSKEAPAPPAAADFFYAPVAGTHYIYKLEPGTSHVVTITKVAGDGGGKQSIELHERIANLPTLPGEIEFRTDYTVDNNEDVVYWVRRYLGGSEKIVALRGPIKEGTKWEVRHWRVDLDKNAVGPEKTTFLSCGIADMPELEVMGEKWNCLRVVCSEKEGLQKLRRSFCKGLGYAGTETMQDGKFVPAETLIRILDFPEGEPM